MNKKILSNKPPKGTYDWFPEEFSIRKYIFDIWREVCTSFGYEEYLTPILESAEIYRAKSGEDVGGKELMTMTDRADRELAIRPEMTPSVTRMVSQIYGSTAKPIRYFSIANFYRDQKPQRGRNKEFWQLNYDIFGSDSIEADVEIIQIGLEIMLSFNPPKGSFVVYINNRKLIDEILNNIANINEALRTEVVRTLDKWEKLSLEDFSAKLIEIGLNVDQADSLVKFMNSESSKDLLQAFPELEENEGFQEIKKIISDLSNLGYSDWIKFQPNVIRGFDYYDGMVFEVFDTNPENKRSLFGGGRYGGLARLFGSESFPAVGCAPGDETTKLFLESWKLIDEVVKKTKLQTIFIPLIDENLVMETKKISQELRENGLRTAQGLEVESLGKSLSSANSKNYDYVVLFGEKENAESKVTLKNMRTGDQEMISLKEAINKIKK